MPVQELAVPHLQALFPESQVSPVLHADLVAEHLHTLLVASQKAPVLSPLHEDAVPQVQAPEVHVSLVTLHVIEAHASTTAAIGLVGDDEGPP